VCLCASKPFPSFSVRSVRTLPRRGGKALPTSARLHNYPKSWLRRVKSGEWQRGILAREEE